MVQVECIARGYLTGSGFVEYQRTGAVSGVALPEDLVESSRLPQPVFTPTSKAPVGVHDQPMTFDDVVTQEGPDAAAELRRLTLEIYQRGCDIAARSGIMIADTKVEFGRDRADTLVLGDEVLTPDSSRFWRADDYQPGRTQRSFDKQYVRDWAAGTGWDKTAPGPAIPEQVVAATRDRYIDVFQQLTRMTWSG